MAWRLASSLVLLRAQINAEWPNRSKVSDGTIGDAAHRNRQSDHNPNAVGVVTAFDCTHDPTNGAHMHLLAEELRESKDPRIKYIIFNRRLFSSYWVPGREPWEWAAYTGTNPHTTHLHISVVSDASLYDRTDPWQIGGEVAQFSEEDAAFLAAFSQEARRMGSNGKDFANWILRLFRSIRNVFADN